MSIQATRLNNSIADEVQFKTVVGILLQSYTPAGVHIWLGSPNRQLDGQRPIDLCTTGSWLRVRECAERIESAS